MSSAYPRRIFRSPFGSPGVYAKLRASLFLENGHRLPVEPYPTNGLNLPSPLPLGKQNQLYLSAADFHAAQPAGPFRISKSRRRRKSSR